MCFVKTQDNKPYNKAAPLRNFFANSWKDISPESYQKPIKNVRVGVE
jgi:hypothetical protein